MRLRTVLATVTAALAAATSLTAAGPANAQNSHACSPSVSIDRFSDALDKTTYDGTFVGNTDHVNFIPAAGMHVVDIGDYNGDAIDDLLWQTSDGTVTSSLGQTDGSFVDNSAHVNIHTGTDWHVQSPFVHDLFL